MNVDIRKKENVATFFSDKTNFSYCIYKINSKNWFLASEDFQIYGENLGTPDYNEALFKAKEIVTYTAEKRLESLKTFIKEIKEFTPIEEDIER